MEEVLLKIDEENNRISLSGDGRNKDFADPSLILHTFKEFGAQDAKEVLKNVLFLNDGLDRKEILHRTVQQLSEYRKENKQEIGRFQIINFDVAIFSKDSEPNHKVMGIADLGCTPVVIAFFDSAHASGKIPLLWPKLKTSQYEITKEEKEGTETNVNIHPEFINKSLTKTITRKNNIFGYGIDEDCSIHVEATILVTAKILLEKENEIKIL